MLAHKAPIHYLKIAEHSNDVAITFSPVICPSSKFDCRYFPKCCTISYLNFLHSEGIEMISTKLITARACNFLFLFKGEWCRPHVDNLLDTNVPEVCNDFSLLKGPLPAEVKALTDTLYLHPN